MAETLDMHFMVSGATEFDLEFHPMTAVRAVKRLAHEYCAIAPEHMRLIYKGRLLKEDDTFEGLEIDAPVQVMYTAGHEGLVGGS